MPISAFFSEKTLVSQQIASFNEFVTNTMQELVDENSTLILDQNMQYTGKESDETRRYEIKFGQIYLSRPTQTESDGSVNPMFPNEARLRNLTYSAPLYVDIEKSLMKHAQGEYDPVTGEPIWEKVEEAGLDDAAQQVQKVYIGKVPIMLQSDFCILQPQDEASLFELNECPFDMVFSFPNIPCGRYLSCPSLLFVYVGRIFYYQWLRKGSHRPGTNSRQPSLRFCKSATLGCHISGRD